MSNKITLSELADILSVNSKLMSKKSDWETFLKLLFAEITDALDKDKIVKVKGLGTFKLVKVEPRKSVNIKTGEAVIIPSHAKISFSPDTALALTINKPYAYLEVTTLAPNGPVDPEEKEDLDNDILPVTETDSTVADTKTQTSSPSAPLPDGIVKASEKIAQAIERINNIGKETTEEIKEENNYNSVEVESAVENSTETDSNIETSNTESTQTENKEEEAKEESNTDNSTDDSLNNNKAETQVEENKQEEIEPKSNKKHNNKKLGIILVLIVLFIGNLSAILWISDPDIVNKLRDKINNPVPVKVEEVKVPVVTPDTTTTTETETDTVANAIKDSLIQEVISTEVTKMEDVEVKELPEKKEEPKLQQKIKFRDDFVKYMKSKHPEIDLTADTENIETIEKGDRLTLVSLRNYGQKDFWVYLYLYNYNTIKNPNNVRPGTKIKIPALKTSLVNPDSEECINIAREVKAKFIK